MPPAARNIDTLTREECETFRGNPTRNPLTNRAIDPTKDVARRIRRHCDAVHPRVVAQPQQQHQQPGHGNEQVLQAARRRVASPPAQQAPAQQPQVAPPNNSEPVLNIGNVVRIGAQTVARDIYTIGNRLLNRHAHIIPEHQSVQTSMFARPITLMDVLDDSNNNPIRFYVDVSKIKFGVRWTETYLNAGKRDQPMPPYIRPTRVARDQRIQEVGFTVARYQQVSNQNQPQQRAEPGVDIVLTANIHVSPVIVREHLYNMGTVIGGHRPLYIWHIAGFFNLQLRSVQPNMQVQHVQEDMIQAYKERVSLSYGRRWCNTYFNAGLHNVVNPNYVTPQIQHNVNASSVTRSNQILINICNTLLRLSTVVQGQNNTTIPRRRLIYEPRELPLVQGQNNTPIPRRPDMDREDLEALRPFLDEAEIRRLTDEIEQWERHRAHSPLINKKTHSATDVDFGSLPTGCMTMFTDVSPEFNGFANKMRKVCKDLHSKCNAQALNTLRERLRAFNPHGVSHNYNLTFTKQQVDSKILIKTLWNTFKQGNTDPQMFNHLWRTNIDRLRIEVRGSQGIGSGVTRTTLQQMADEIHSLNMFVPAEDGGTRYVVNPAAIHPSFFNDMGFASVSTTKDVKEVFWFLGNMFAFMLRFDIPIKDIYLSYAILARLMFKESEIDASEEILYFFLDMPNTSKPDANLLQRADDIEHCVIEMNGRFNLVPSAENEDITKHNFVKYLSLLSRHWLTRQITPDARNTFEFLQAFIDGFYMRNELRRANATVQQLDQLLGGSMISEEQLRLWMQRDLIQFHQVDEQKKRWFKDIMLDMGDSFPFAEIGEDRDKLSAEERKTIFLGFISRLMYFWTGVRRMSMHNVHQVIMLPSEGLPTSSTCFYQLKLPNNLRNRADLYKRLVTAVYNVESIVGLHGGAGKKKRIQ